MSSLPDHPFRLILFDLDGTLVDSQMSICLIMREAFVNAGLEPPDLPATRRIVGLSRERAVAELLPQESDDSLVSKLVASYREAYWIKRDRRELDEPLFDGAFDILKALNRPEVCLGIATGRHRRSLNAILEGHGLEEMFVVIKTPEDGPSKPSPEILNQAMAEMGASREETVFIGDTIYDMQAGRNAGVRAIAAAWGYHEADELAAAGAARVLDDIREVPGVLRDL